MSGFKVTVDGRSWLTDDLTLDEIIDIDERTGQKWGALANPFSSPAACKEIMVAFLSRSRDRDEAVKLVGALTLTELVAAIETVTEDDLPDVFEDGIPKAGGAPATTG